MGSDSTDREFSLTTQFAFSTSPAQGAINMVDCNAAGATTSTKRQIQNKIKNPLNKEKSTNQDKKNETNKEKSTNKKKKKETEKDREIYRDRERER